jgi:hypothetical protein
MMKLENVPPMLETAMTSHYRIEKRQLPNFHIFAKWSSKRLLTTPSDRQSPYTHESQTGHKSDDKCHTEGTISGLGSYVEVVPCLQNDGFIAAKSTFAFSMHSERSPASGQDHRNI